MKLAIAQINTKTGDIDGNLELATQFYRDAVNAGADLVLYPELTITGYPPEDLIFKEDFLQESMRAVRAFAKDTSITAIIGSPYLDGQWDMPFNGAAICGAGQVVDWQFKQNLPTYGVFDEARYFIPGVGLDSNLCIVNDIQVGISICEDMWVTPRPPIRQAEAGADLLVNLSASPFCSHRFLVRHKIVNEICRSTGRWMAYCNLVGGQDELVFDGASFVCDPYGQIIARAKQFEEDLLIVDLDSTEKRTEDLYQDSKEIYQALVLGTHDYVRKNGFSHVVLGLSGGIDSALVAAIAVDALGANHVTGVLMPSRFSSVGSIADAKRLADNLGIETYTIPIEDMHASYEGALSSIFSGTEVGVAEENIQARIRGNIIMAFANKFGWMALTTGNKSEMAMGYATLYGDMAGGFAVIKDVPKTLVFQLCHLINEKAAGDYHRIPEQIIYKAPSAELKADQVDTDSLPPYDILDPIIEKYVEQDMSIEDIVAEIVETMGEHDFWDARVRKVATAIDRNEYKRRQAPPGIRVTPKAFGKDRRLPITNGWGG